jgi:hypothetical protein
MTDWLTASGGNPLNPSVEIDASARLRTQLTQHAFTITDQTLESFAMFCRVDLQRANKTVKCHINALARLGNFKYVHIGKTGRKDEQISIDDLWDKVRNPIAHSNRKPSFAETYGALNVLVSFIQDFPKTLKTWQP